MSMKKYNRVMLGQGSKYAKMCRQENYIGADFEIYMDLSDFLYDNWRDFNEKFIPIWMQNVPGKSKTAAGLACGFLWTIVKGLKMGDVEKLNNLNKDFNTFIAKLSKVINATKEYTADAKSSFEKICDSIFKSDEEFETYCKSHNIPF